MLCSHALPSSLLSWASQRNVYDSIIRACPTEQARDSRASAGVAASTYLLVYRYHPHTDNSNQISAKQLYLLVSSHTLPNSDLPQSSTTLSQILQSQISFPILLSSKYLSSFNELNSIPPYSLKPHISRTLLRKHRSSSSNLPSLPIIPLVASKP